MPNVIRFGSVLARLRQEQGFSSAHAFYRSRKGRNWMGLSFASYLALEKGTSLPKPERLARLVELLGLTAGSEPARELARAYLLCLAGEAPLRLAGFDGEAAPAVNLAELAARQVTTQRTEQLDLEQWKTLASDAGVYFCHAFLINTPGWTAAADVAKAAGLNPAQAKKALKILSDAKLVETAGGRCRSPYAGKVILALPKVPEASAIRSRIYAHRRRWTEGGGKMAHAMQVTVRLPASRLKQYLRHLDETMALGSVYGDVGSGPDTAVYLVDARVFEIFK